MRSCKMKKMWIPALIFILLITGCSSTEQLVYQPGNIADAVAVSSDDGDNSAADTPIPATEVPPPADTPVSAITHSEFPGEFKLTPLQRIVDCVMGNTLIPAEEITLSESCDQWERNYFERPVDKELVDFFPQLDIVQSEFGQDELWYYTRIQVYNEGLSEIKLDGIYALEIDLNLDARGDILILAASPGIYPVDEWQSDGVQVWLDKNDDVGGPQAVLVDPGYDGDGYEELIFDAGLGEDPDLAFVKTYSYVPGLLEFGFKLELLNGTEIFEWWVWAMLEDLGAAKYDPVDFYSQDTLFGIDNTCGWIYGSYLRDLPNICQTITVPEAPKENSGPSCPPPKFDCAAAGGVWEDYPYCQCVIN